MLIKSRRHLPCSVCVLTEMKTSPHVYVHVPDDIPVRFFFSSSSLHMHKQAAPCLI